MNKGRNWVLFIISFLFLNACSFFQDDEENKENIVAKFKKEVLTRKELNFHLPSDIGAEDSVKFSKIYIDNWLKQQAAKDFMLKKDEKLEEKNKFLIQDYKNKLFVQEFHNHIIKNKLDTIVTQKQISKYYNKNKQKFQTETNIYKFFYFEVFQKRSKVLEEWFNSKKKEDFEKLEDWCGKNAISFKLDSTYILESDLQPLEEKYNYKFSNLPANANMIVIDRTFVKNKEKKLYFCYFRMFDKIAKGNPLPLPMLESNIRNNILYLRKTKIIEKEEKNLLKNAYEHNYITK